MDQRKRLREKKKIVIKVGTSNLTYPNGKVNFKKIEKLSMVLSNIRNSGKDVILVSSGSIAVGSGKLSWKNGPQSLAQKQAIAAVGQAELMKIYQKFFGEYNQVVAQILLTRDVMIDPVKKKNARNTIDTLLEMGIIPIINENDTVSTDEIEHIGYGDNDRLSADVATLIGAELLIILSDIDGLYSADPREDQSAHIIYRVDEITAELEKMASGKKGSGFAKGGMSTKIAAVKICKKAGIDVIITNGKNPPVLFDILQGKMIGTMFVANK